MKTQNEENETIGDDREEKERPSSHMIKSDFND